MFSIEKVEFLVFVVVSLMRLLLPEETEKEVSTLAFVVFCFFVCCIFLYLLLCLFVCCIFLYLLLPEETEVEVSTFCKNICL